MYLHPPILSCKEAKPVSSKGLVLICGCTPDFQIFHCPCMDSRLVECDQVYFVSRDIPDRTQRWRGVPFLQYNNKKCFIKFWAINKTEVQKIDVEVQVSGWLWLD